MGKSHKSNALIPPERIERAILLIRGQKLMIDADLAALYGRATDGRVERVEEILETLEALGKARALDDGRYVAV